MASQQKSPTPSLEWSPNLLPIDDPVDSLSAPAGRGQRFVPKVAPKCATACRVVTSIYALRLKRWRQGAGF
jgi:hypothetical protein